MAGAVLNFMKKIFFSFFILTSISAYAEQMQDIVGTVNEDGRPLQAAPAQAAPPPVDGEPLKPAPAAPKEFLVGYLDVEYAFKNHPWTAQTKREFKAEIDKRAMDIASAESEVSLLKESNAAFLKELDDMRPFYQTVDIAGGAPQLPAQGRAGDIEFDNIVAHIIYSGADARAYSPVDSPEILSTIKDTIKENEQIIKDKELFIEQARAAAGSDIKTKEQEEVLFIMEDIYTELKDYARKRNVKIIVSKKEVLYGENPVDITLDFTERLKRDKKSKPKKKEKK